MSSTMFRVKVAAEGAGCVPSQIRLSMAVRPLPQWDLLPVTRRRNQYAR